jgi:nucleoside-diphosphate-sugar epimerase
MERTYVVTGAASGIGAATSQMLKSAGNKVVGVDIHNTDVTVDLSTVLGRHQAARDVIKATNGSIDAVIACAGLASSTAKTVSVNYFGVTNSGTFKISSCCRNKFNGIFNAKQPRVS